MSPWAGVGLCELCILWQGFWQVEFPGALITETVNWRVPHVCPVGKSELRCAPFSQHLCFPPPFCFSLGLWRGCLVLGLHLTIMYSQYCDQLWGSWVPTDLGTLPAYFYFKCMYVLPSCLHVYFGTHRVQKRALSPLVACSGSRDGEHVILLIS